MIRVRLAGLPCGCESVDLVLKVNLAAAAKVLQDRMDAAK